MRINRVLSVVLFLITINICSAQEERLKNAFFLEVLGNAGAYSFNYEYQFASKTLTRIGICFFPDAFSVPVIVGQLVGKSKNFLELGVGTTIVHYGAATDNGNIVYLTGVIGYRYQKPDGKFLFRLGFTPLYNVYVKEGDEVSSFLPLGGVSVGLRF